MSSAIRASRSAIFRSRICEVVGPASVYSQSWLISALAHCPQIGRVPSQRWKFVSIYTRRSRGGMRTIFRLLLIAAEHEELVRHRRPAHLHLRHAFPRSKVCVDGMDMMLVQGDPEISNDCWSIGCRPLNSGTSNQKPSQYLYVFACEHAVAYLFTSRDYVWKLYTNGVKLKLYEPTR